MKIYAFVIISCFLGIALIYVGTVIECVTLRAQSGIEADMATIIDCSY